jgi:putative Mg2+ transporter-C (MgtC) family protein
MNEEHLVVVARLLAATLIGSFIGFERTFHGRPAGFRTHSLVCVSSALLMPVAIQQNRWMTGVPPDSIRTDPTRMAQGIMTGIGFLGAGVIFREGLTVRGLTTAASIWMTAAIGILVGIGSHFTALAGALLTLTILSLFRIIEGRLPSEIYAHHVLRMERNRPIGEKELRRQLKSHGFSIANLSIRLIESGKMLEYRMVIRSRDRGCAEKWSRHLLEQSGVIEFRISPTGD